MKTFQQLLRERIAAVADGVEFDVLVPSDPTFGDYATNIAFVLAKKEGRKPVDVANELKDKLGRGTLPKMVDIEVAPNGFLNFFVKSEFLQKELLEIKSDARFGQSDEGAGKKVIVEYSSVNMAKPMHIGHLRSTIIGDAIANIYETLGYDVIRWNYLGDWGTQIGKVIAGYKKWGADKELTLADILKLYVKASKELSEDAGRDEFRQLEEGNPETRRIWELIRSVSIKELEGVYKDLGVHGFDTYKGESAYESELKPLIEYLTKNGTVKESEGALIIDLEKHALP